MKLRYSYILILLTVSSCIKEISLDSDFKAETFIFGTLTNKTKHLSIHIEESVPLNAAFTKPVNNATISLYTKNANQDIALISNNFIEVNDGVYTSSQVVSSIVGNYYWIEVRLQDGTSFKSAEELLKPKVDINNVATANERTKISFSDPGNDTNYYQLFYNYDIDDGFFTSYELSNDLLFNGSENAFIEMLALPEDGTNITYALVNINFSTYQFYFNLQQEGIATEERDGAGDPSELFTPPSVHLKGNIINTTTNKIALGNFGVVSISFN